jgi:hypothetical protein
VCTLGIPNVAIARLEARHNNTLGCWMYAAAVILCDALMTPRRDLTGRVILRDRRSSSGSHCETRGAEDTNYLRTASTYTRSPEPDEYVLIPRERMIDRERNS